MEGAAASSLLTNTGHATSVMKIEEAIQVNSTHLHKAKEFTTSVIREVRKKMGACSQSAGSLSRSEELLKDVLEELKRGSKEAEEARKNHQESSKETSHLSQQLISNLKEGLAAVRGREEAVAARETVLRQEEKRFFDKKTTENEQVQEELSPSHPIASQMVVPQQQKEQQNQREREGKEKQQKVDTGMKTRKRRLEQEEMELDKSTRQRAADSGDSGLINPPTAESESSPSHDQCRKSAKGKRLESSMQKRQGDNNSGATPSIGGSADDSVSCCVVCESIFDDVEVSVVLTIKITAMSLQVTGTNVMEPLMFR